MNHFKFHPVGQGLFYTGSLDDGRYNFVYDCGSTTKKRDLFPAIDRYIDDLKERMSCAPTMDKPSIDFVVISHLHKDHFNGLYQLSQMADIQKLFLPYLGRDEDFISLILANLIFKDESQNESKRELFIFMLELYEREEIYYHYGEQIHQEDDKQEDTYFQYSVGTPLSVDEDKKPSWKFIFLNRAISDYVINNLSQKLKDYMKKKGIKKIVDLVEDVNRIQEIKEIYDEVFNGNDSLNDTSTILIHHPLTCPHSSEQQNITLLSGDVTADWIFNKCITKTLEYHHCDYLQVPHHGSDKNWRAWEKYMDIIAQDYVISYGWGNGYKHPHFYTMDSINKKLIEKYMPNQILDHIHLVNQTHWWEYSID